MAVYTWSQTAGSNSNADSTINWSEGQAPSTINDSARAMMAALAKFRDDISGAIVTTGTSSAYAVTSNSGFDTLAHLNGQMIALTPHVNNGPGPITLNVDGLGAKPFRLAPNLEIQSGSLVQGTPYFAIYNNSDGAFYLHGASNSAYSIPLAGSIDFWGSTAPNSAFAFPYGQAISRTTYSTLFSVIGTAYGAGDGTTTFNLPDCRGRIIATLDTLGGTAASRLTNASGVNGNTMGGTGGAQVYALAQSQLPNVAPTFTGTQQTWFTQQNGVPYNTTNQTINNGSGSAFFLPKSDGSSYGQLSIVITPSGTISSINGNQAQQNISNMPPVIVAGRIMRII